MEDQVHKPHRKSKVKKKPTEGKNPKAFSFNAPGRTQRQQARGHDVREKRLHVPLIDRVPEEAPPIVVAVVGPPGVGKTTLIKSLVKRYAKHSLTSPTGPLTVVTSKRRRLTFIECPSDSLASMIDISKVVDIVLLMIDGNFGFEMETMEFLNILSSSGMPGNVFGILTHLDLFKKMSTLKEAKKRLKHRFWTELYQGAKLFYLSGVINGRYPDREIHNLSRFLSVMKNPRPLVWRNSHPYCLADRFLDVTPPTSIEENAKCDRVVALYGYLRGTNFPAVDARVHLPGVGDLRVASVEKLPDPCPTPFMDQAIAKATGKSKNRRLGEKQKTLYAPMSDVGGVLVDKDAVYIDVKSNTFDIEDEDENRGLGEQMVVGLQGGKRLLGETQDGVRLFQSGAFIGDDQDVQDTGRKGVRTIRRMETGDGDDQVDGLDDLSDEDEDGDSEVQMESVPERHLGKLFSKEMDTSASNGTNGQIEYADSDSDLGSISSVDDQEFDEGTDMDSNGDDEDFESGDEEVNGEDHDLRWKSNLRARAAHAFTKRPGYRINELSKLLYDTSITPHQVAFRWRTGENPDSGSNDEVEDEDVFFQRAKNDDGESPLECQTITNYDYDNLKLKWEDEDVIDRMRRRFASGVKVSDGIGPDQQSGSDAEDSEGDGEFEDLENPEPNDDVANEQSDDDGERAIEAERERNARRKEELKLRFEEEDREGFLNDKSNARSNAPDQQAFGEDEWYEAQKSQIQTQLAINQSEADALDEESRARVHGYRAGSYVKIVLEKVPFEFVSHFNPKYPVLIGGLSATEERFGFVQVRIKRHRWHKKILKTNDPLIFSMGWRRFQTMPVYSISDSRTRNRMLKYTPEHMHCFGNFYGPLIAPNTGFCCVQSFSSKNPGFRIAATGVVLNVDENTEIVKKLKLTGEPAKIFRNTAFIKGMFNSALEIAKFEGASIKTVSGIRGQIKRALAKPEGQFRATFEDKLLMSDIVFLRAWYPVKPHRFYNLVTERLDSDAIAEPSAGWQGMRLTGEVRAQENIPTPLVANSAYRPIERQTRKFNPLRVPKQLAADLPFKSQITLTKRQAEPTYMQKRAVIVGTEERKARNMLQMLMTLKKEKDKKRKEKKEANREVYRAKVRENEEKREEREKRERDEYWSREGKKRWRQADGAEGGQRNGRGGKKVKS